VSSFLRFLFGLASVGLGLVRNILKGPVRI